MDPYTAQNNNAAKHCSACIVVSDALSCFFGVDDAGFAHESFMTSGDSVDEAGRVFKWGDTMIGNVKNDLRGT